MRGKEGETLDIDEPKRLPVGHARAHLTRTTATGIFGHMREWALWVTKRRIRGE